MWNRSMAPTHVPIFGAVPSPQCAEILRLSGLFHKYAHVRGNGFWAEARRERRAYPAADLVRSEQRRLRPKDMPPCGLRPIWPVASLLGRSGIAADTLPPRASPRAQVGATNVCVFMK